MATKTRKSEKEPTSKPPKLTKKERAALPPYQRAKVIGTNPHADRGSAEAAERQHRSHCLVCVANAEDPDKQLEAVCKGLYDRWFSPQDIEEMFGYYDEVKEVAVTPKKGEEATTKMVTVRKPNLPARSVWRHAVFFDWDVERAQNNDQILDRLIDAGMNNVMYKGTVDEKTLLSALDMRNKKRGEYFKPQRNPKDIIVQLNATVEAILTRHHSEGQMDVTRADVIEALSKRPGFEHIKIMLKE